MNFYLLLYLWTLLGSLCAYEATSRIVGGTNAKLGDVPHTVAVTYLGGQLCGGVLLSKRYALTAAHCVRNIDMYPSRFTVQLGQLDRLTSPVQELVVSRIIIHPLYTSSTGYHDLAVIEMNGEANTHLESIEPVELPDNHEENFDTYIGTTSGWGATCEGCSTSVNLKMVNMPIWTAKACNDAPGYAPVDADVWICAGDVSGGVAACGGDSGGPLTVEFNDKTTLVGVVSWGIGCGTPGQPTVFTRISNYLGWLKSSTDLLLGTRTVVFMKYESVPGENLFARGGIDHAIRPGCTNDAYTSQCSIPIKHVGDVHSSYVSYHSWKHQDNHLDWYGAEPNQGSYSGLHPLGSPLAWTTNDPLSDGFQIWNSFGDHYWMLEIEIDCSKTEDGWFEVKGVLMRGTIGFWEKDVNQISCTGSAGGISPYASNNHLGKCGKLNVFTFNSDDCIINDL